MDSFIVLPGKRLNDNAVISKRRELIIQLCEGRDNSYKTEYPHIVKLCRTCIIDVCSELTDICNWYTSCYKRYIEIKDKLEKGILEISDPTRMINEINIEITTSKYQYNNHYSFLQELKKKKLYAKGCVICNGSDLK